MNRRQFIFRSLALTLAASTGYTVYQYQSLQGSDNAAVLVLDALLPAVLMGALPSDAAAQQLSLQQSRDAVLEFMAYLPQNQQQQLQQLFQLLQQDLVRLALTGQWLQLADLPLSQRLDLLLSWRDSYFALLRQAFSGLRELIYGAFYGQPEHWLHLNYRAPEFNP
ncbi:hypothetical protein [Rheinheimera sp.]|uniref:hypothetical protein n=1 Tax=Rheinheimera sp. TaxID=1869214 RepID=UPI0026242E5E|nr:hypothetical protein [Rheinheimera sp.]MCA1931719.1 hypothetical protein [Rheinheimera sp.]